MDYAQLKKRIIGVSDSDGAVILLPVGYKNKIPKLFGKPARERVRLLPRKSRNPVLEFSKPVLVLHNHDLNMARSSDAQLRVGCTVPDFDADTTQGRINFYEQIKGNWAILFAFPDDFTPVATTELVSFTELQSEFAQRHVRLFALSTNNTPNFKGEYEPHEKWVQDINDVSDVPLLFPIITDREGKISLAYNVLEPSDAEAVQSDETVGGGVAFKSRSVFIIDNQKRLRLVFNYPAAVGLNTMEVFRVVDCLQTAARADVRTPANYVPGGVVIVPPKYSDESAKRKFPGFKAVKPYLRFYTLPEEKTSVAQIHDMSDKAAEEFLVVDN